MRTRYLTVGAAVWAAGYTGLYIAVLRYQGSSPAWWYAGLLATGVTLVALSALGRWPRPMLISGAVILALAALAALPSIGLFLVPAVAAGAIAAASSSGNAHIGHLRRRAARGHGAPD
jgi:hypothetical protein